jgi:hypothetical protein
VKKPKPGAARNGIKRYLATVKRKKSAHRFERQSKDGELVGPILLATPEMLQELVSLVQAEDTLAPDAI